MKNEKLLFAAVAIIGWALSQALSGVKLPSGYDVGTVLAWVAGIGAIGFVAQFFNSVSLSDTDEQVRPHELHSDLSDHQSMFQDTEYLSENIYISSSYHHTFND